MARAADKPGAAQIRDAPVVVVSACLLSAPCRWDADIKIYDVTDFLSAGATVIPVCPEVSVGLGVPRPPIRIVSDCTGLRLVRPLDGLDLTDKIRGFARSFVESLPRGACFLLKSRSPSCGVTDAEVFPSLQAEFPAGRSCGIFAAEIQRRLPAAVMADEKRPGPVIEILARPGPIATARWLPAC